VDPLPQKHMILQRKPQQLIKKKKKRKTKKNMMKRTLFQDIEKTHQEPIVKQEDTLLPKPVKVKIVKIVIMDTIKRSINLDIKYNQHLLQYHRD
jgi:hypothetical protein